MSNTFDNLRAVAPMPWVLEQFNDSGIVIKDNRGNVIFEADFGSIPDEAPSHIRESEITRQRALAQYLLTISGNPLFT